MTKQKKNQWRLGLVAAFVVLTACMAFNPFHAHHSAPTHTSASVMRRPMAYTKASETKGYPKQMAKSDQIIVSTKHQRAYLENAQGKKLYTFYVSTGRDKKNQTPKGTYQINKTRAKWFYDDGEHEGARYSVGFHDGGKYLFHETPSNKKGQIIKPDAEKLGKRGTSYGCIHMTEPDSLWFYDHVPTGMKVVIK